jgi:hypothetical protein
MAHRVGAGGAVAAAVRPRLREGDALTVGVVEERIAELADVRDVTRTDGGVDG